MDNNVHFEIHSRDKIYKKFKELDFNSGSYAPVKQYCQS